MVMEAIIQATATIMVMELIIQVKVTTTAMARTNQARDKKQPLEINAVNKVKKVPDTQRVSGTFFTFE